MNSHPSSTTELAADDAIDLFVTNLRAISIPTASAAIVRPRHASARVLTPAILVAGAIAAGIWLRPLPAVAAPWAQVVANTAGAETRHSREFSRSGQLVYEEWSAPGKLAFWYRERGTEPVSLEHRFDGRRLYRFDRAGEGTLTPGPNSFVVGTVRDRSKIRFDALSRPMSVERFVLSVDGTVEEFREGDRTTYRVRRKKSNRAWDGERSVWRRERSSYVVRVDDQRRIVEIEVSDGSRIRYDYPDAVSERIFEPRPQARIVPVIDVDQAKRAARERIRRGLGRASGVTMRLVLLDAQGAVWLLWTGAPPNGSLSRPARIVGVRTGPAWGPKEFTSSIGGAANRRVSPSIGVQLEGHALVPKSRVSDHVDVVVPTRKGSATFRRLPVLRVSSLVDVSSELGL